MAERSVPVALAKLQGPLPLPAHASQALFIADDIPVSLTNLEKPMFPDGTRKRDLLDYSYDVAPVLLPYLRDRPYTMKRYPDGIEGEWFFQKEARGPDWLPTVAMPSENERGVIHYALCQNTAALLYLVNNGCIDHNVWMSRAATPLAPDIVLLDLDPGPRAPFSAVVRVAVALRKLLEGFEIAGYPKTSGATGMHIWIPIAAGHTFAQTQQFAALLMRMVAARLPELVTEVLPLADRPQDKVYLDFRQNAHNKTIPPPYSPRPVPGAHVSCPLRWSELTSRLDPARFTLGTMRRRLERYGDLFAPTLPGVPHETLQAMLRRIQRQHAA